MNVTVKALLVVFVALFVYFLSILFMSYFLVPQSGSSMQEMMGHMMGFSQQGGAYLNGVLAVTLGLGAGLVMAVLFGLFSSAQSPQAAQPVQPTLPSSAQHPTEAVDELQIIRKVLSDDEKAVVDEIRRAGTITQDSLRFRLGWSKAKVSRILTNLDKMNLVQRERVGKTYNVFLTEKKK
jgi:hypothetical protein